MIGRSAVLLCIVVASCWIQSASAGRVQIWMCLERCNFTSSQVDVHLQQVAKYKQHISAISFEAYNLGPNRTLVWNNLTDITSTVLDLGLSPIPMISSYPYPPQFLDWMREVFKDPTTFIDQCVDAALKKNYTGYCVDWEPTAKASAQDAMDYAEFISKFADAMHAHGKIVTVTMADWNAIWNWTALANSRADRLQLMSTYASRYTTFLKKLKKGVAKIGLEKLGVGLLTTTPTKPPHNRTHAGTVKRFKQIEAVAAREIDIWKSPIPEDWWPLIQYYAYPY